MFGKFPSRGHFTGPSLARITRNGAHGLIPWSLASSATSHGPIPPREWARAVNSDKRSLGVSWRALTNLSRVGAVAMEVEAIGRPEGSAPVDRLLRRLMLRRSLAALIWHLGLQNLWGRAPLRWAGAGKGSAPWAHVKGMGVSHGAGLLLPIGPVGRRSVDWI
jgi:hypothetical protein